MKSKARVWVSTFLLAGAILPYAKSAPAAEGDEQAVMAASAQFYAALNQMFTGDQVK